MKEIYKDKSDEDLIKICWQEANSYNLAFNELVERYKNYVFKIAFDKLKNVEDAEDATQEIFVRAFFGLKNFRFDAQFKTWLTRIAINVCLTILLTRKRKMWQYHISLNGEADLESIYTSLISKDDELFFWKKISEVLKKMTHIYRKVFIFKYFKNFSLSSISKRLNATIPAVKMKIKRAKDQFIKIFTKA